MRPFLLLITVLALTGAAASAAPAAPPGGGSGGGRGFNCDSASGRCTCSGGYDSVDCQNMARNCQTPEMRTCNRDLNECVCWMRGRAPTTPGVRPPLISRPPAMRPGRG